MSKSEVFTFARGDATICVMARLKIILFALILGSAISSSGQQRPLLTDDIDITPAGSLDIAVGIEFLQNAKFPLSGLKGDLTRVGDIRIRTGLASNVEIQISGTLQNYLAINSRRPGAIPLNVTSNSTNDFDDIVFSTKVKLRNESKRLPALGFKFGFEMPNTDQARGIGTNTINIFSKVIVQKRFGSYVNRTPRLNLYGNIGFGILSSPTERFSQNDVILYGLAGIYRVTGRINAVAEVNGRQNIRGTAPIGTESQGEFRIGTQIKASGLRFDSAAILGLSRSSPRTGIVFGVTYQTPTIFTPAK